MATIATYAGALSHSSQKRHVNFRHELTHLNRRQFNNCTPQCAPVGQALAYNNTPCLCPIFNIAGLEVDACTSCLQPVEPLVASNITLLSQVCLHCQSQCSTTLTAYIGALACNSTACECALYVPVGGAAISACANCANTFNPAIAAGLIQIAEQCNISIPSSSTATTSTTQMSSASTTQISPTSTSATSLLSSSSASSAVAAVTLPTVSNSAAFHLEPQVYRTFSWMIMTLGVFGYAFLVL